jgi:hypothetical protein
MSSSALLSLYGKSIHLMYLKIPSIFLARRSIHSLYYRKIVFEQSRRTLHDQSESSGADSNPAYDFVRRHIGPNERQTKEMLHTLGVKSMDELIDKTVPPAIKFQGTMNIPEALCK